MEKEKQSSKLKNKFSKITAAISVTFQNPPFSPSRVVNKSHHGSSRGFSSSPLVPKVGGNETQQEPTSPTISCMGQIKHKKMQMKKSRSLSVALSSHMRSDDDAGSSSSPRLVKNSKQSASSRFQRMLMFKPPKPEKSGSVGGGGSSAAVGDEGSGKIIGPPLGEMRRFASGRDSFASFDWKAQVAPDEIEQQRDCYTDEKRRDTVNNTFSGPILGGFQANLQQRKEINLWKRRTTAQPRPLQLKPVLTAR